MATKSNLITITSSNWYVMDFSKNQQTLLDRIMEKVSIPDKEILEYFQGTIYLMSEQECIDDINKLSKGDE